MTPYELRLRNQAILYKKQAIEISYKIQRLMVEKEHFEGLARDYQRQLIDEGNKRVVKVPSSQFVHGMKPKRAAAPEKSKSKTLTKGGLTKLSALLKGGINANAD